MIAAKSDDNPCTTTCVVYFAQRVTYWCLLSWRYLRATCCRSAVIEWVNLRW